MQKSREEHRKGLWGPAGPFLPCFCLPWPHSRINVILQGCAALPSRGSRDLITSIHFTIFTGYDLPRGGCLFRVTLGKVTSMHTVLVGVRWGCGAPPGESGAACLTALAFQRGMVGPSVHGTGFPVCTAAWKNQPCASQLRKMCWDLVHMSRLFFCLCVMLFPSSTFRSPIQLRDKIKSLYNRRH